jgi:hypothetical protein
MWQPSFTRIVCAFNCGDGRVALPFVDNRVEESDEHDETQNGDDHPNDSKARLGYSIMT